MIPVKGLAHLENRVKEFVASSKKDLALNRNLAKEGGLYDIQIKPRKKRGISLEDRIN